MVESLEDRLVMSGMTPLKIDRDSPGRHRPGQPGIARRGRPGGPDLEYGRARRWSTYSIKQTLVQLGYDIKEGLAAARAAGLLRGRTPPIKVS
ncbi:MAG: hypothetical protein WKF75_17665 [Singulisphaera sp.]